MVASRSVFGFSKDMWGVGAEDFGRGSTEANEVEVENRSSKHTSAYSKHGAHFDADEGSNDSEADTNAASSSSASKKERRRIRQDNAHSLAYCSVDMEDCSTRFVLSLTDEIPSAGNSILATVRGTLWKVAGFMMPCIARGRHWNLQRYGRSGDQWEEIKDVSSSSIGCGGMSSGVCGEGLKPAGYTAGRLTSDDSLEACTYLDFEPVQPPLPDKPTAIRFSVHRVRSAILRIRPTRSAIECADPLLLLSASLQTLAGAWHLTMLLLRPWDLFFEGEVLTFWLHYCQFVTGLLMIHKKLHAVWYVRVHERASSADVRADWCRCFQRTPTPVNLTVIAPSLKTTQAPLLWFAYAKGCRLQTGDTVKIAERFHKRFGEIGVLESSKPDTAMRFEVRFPRLGEIGSFRYHDIELVDEAVRQQRTPVWRDKLTSQVAP
eukprot:TRINITY_DN41440_c0_g1_i2.p1 TRINITY_DN41440_c0_g1~~TRINITY_DN41440_c0_g1_i2.p1  ORF type:complete len:493 (+),score=96.45 TRINITY_DN41440_c0_g1_i2:179-1480(+)